MPSVGEFGSAGPLPTDSSAIDRAKHLQRQREAMRKRKMQNPGIIRKSLNDENRLNGSEAKTCAPRQAESKSSSGSVKAPAQAKGASSESSGYKASSKEEPADHPAQPAAAKSSGPSDAEQQNHAAEKGNSVPARAESKATKSPPKTSEEDDVLRAMKGTEQGESGWYYTVDESGDKLVAYFHLSKKQEWSPVTKPVVEDQWSGKLNPSQKIYLQKLVDKDDNRTHSLINSSSSDSSDADDSPRHRSREQNSSGSDEELEKEELEEQKKKEAEFLAGQTRAPTPQASPRTPFDMRLLKKNPHIPVPEHVGHIQCFIKREKGMYPSYTLWIEPKEKGDVAEFLFMGKKMPRNKTPNYRVFTAPGDTSKSNPSFIGKLRGDFMGREFAMLDTLESHRDKYSKMKNTKVESEAGSVFFELDDTGICDMEIVTPRVKEHTDYNSKGKNPPCILVNKSPRLNSSIGKFVLNFKGRVTCASVKNFQLLDKKNPDQYAIKYQFGKVGKDKFVCDFGYPLSPFQAFCIALSKFDSKESN